MESVVKKDNVAYYPMSRVKQEELRSKPEVQEVKTKKGVRVLAVLKVRG